MPPKLTIALAQINPCVGDLSANSGEILAAREAARGQNADLVVFGELVLSGYPPEDLVRRPSFIAAADGEVRSLARITKDGGPALLIGAPRQQGENLYNAALLLDNGEIKAAQAKHHLPNYGVFDEARVFDSGPLPDPVDFRGLPLGLMICEDMWFADVAAHLKDKGAALLVVLNGSPFEARKTNARLDLAKKRIAETSLPLAYVNLVGGQDELVFDGSSFVVAADGQLTHQAPAWRTTTLPVPFTVDGATLSPTPGTVAPEMDLFESVYWALVTGLHDYVRKNGFPGVVLGLSGGIDSALSAAVAVDALGAEKVLCVMMPSPYTSKESLRDAEACAALLGARYDVLPIDTAMTAFSKILQPVFSGFAADTTEENIQSRIRGLILMALSNKLGHMLLTTGNKSEMSVGYATLYGDMCGGYSVLKDVYKTTVYELAKRRNTHRPDDLLGPEGPVMPQAIIDKAPSAELKPDQTDQDSLPPYEVLDDILRNLIEQERSVGQIVAAGHDEATVRRIWRLLDLAEYKRRQAPPGVKVGRRAFGRDRRYPITNAYSPLSADKETS